MVLGGEDHLAVVERGARCHPPVSRPRFTRRIEETLAKAVAVPTSLASINWMVPTSVVGVPVSARIEPAASIAPVKLVSSVNAIHVRPLSTFQVASAELRVITS